jgi:hypothetical protein
MLRHIFVIYLSSKHRTNTVSGKIQQYTYIFFYIHTVHIGTIKVFFIYQQMHNLIVLEKILKFTLKLTLKQLQNVSV